MLLLITPEVRISTSEFDLSYVRSSGPGGQNVNKVNSKAVLRWNIYSSPSLSPEVRARLVKRLTSQISGEGDIVIASDRFRDQARNRTDCFEKFVKLLAAAAHRPKNRKPTRPTFSSRRKLRDTKTRNSQKKKLRKSGRED